VPGANELHYLYVSDCVSVIKRLASIRGNMTPPAGNLNGLEGHYYRPRRVEGLVVKVSGKHFVIFIGENCKEDKTKN
jgi:hypothetical protein